MRIVVKIGTSVLTRGSESLNPETMRGLVDQIASLHGDGHEIVVCSSGAVAAGRARLDSDEMPHRSVERQMLAALGQSHLTRSWEGLFESHSIPVAQILLTRDGLADRHRFLSVRKTLKELLRRGIVPVVNENDAVSTAEVSVGDNDTLAAFAALLAEADLLVFLTDQPGLRETDPRTDPGAKVIPEVHRIDESLKNIAGKSVNGLGLGGMATKVEAADSARRGGATVVIAHGFAPDVLLRVVGGEAVGTRFPPLARRLEGRNGWILTRRTTHGRVIVDDGAALALTKKKSSLLPAGVVEVEGEFGRGDTIPVLGPDRVEVGCGITRYGSRELGLIRGRHSASIREHLDLDHGPVVIDRGDFVLGEEWKM